MDSILISVKKFLGIFEDDDSFDTEIIMAINSVLMSLTQIGVGSSDGFSIEDDSSEWTDFVEDMSKLQSVKTYVCLKVRLIFDPPTSSAVTEAINKNIAEMEWRIFSEVDFSNN